MKFLTILLVALMSVNSYASGDVYTDLTDTLTKLSKMDKAKGLYKLDGRTIRARLSVWNSEEVSITSPIYQISNGLIEERGTNSYGAFVFNDDTWEIKKKTTKAGGLSTTTFFVKNMVWDHISEEDRPQRQALYIESENGEIIRVGVGVSSNGVKKPEIMIMTVKNWSTPDISIEE